MQWNDVNEHELLALIEDELDPDEAAAVRGRPRGGGRPGVHSATVASSQSGAVSWS